MGLAESPLTAITYLELLPQNREKEEAVSRFRKLSHTIWHGQDHILWVPKYQYRILDGPIKDAAHKGIHSICGYAGCEVVEMNVQKDHVHLIVMVPPKLAISDVMDRVKRQTAIKLLKKFRYLRQKPYWGNQSPVLWAGFFTSLFKDLTYLFVKISQRSLKIFAFLVCLSCDQW
jgi:putative transposase